jgi:hypothetical protein
MKKLVILAVASVLSLSAAAAEQTTLEYTVIEGDYLDTAAIAELKYEADLGGYVYAKHTYEKSNDIYAAVKSGTTEIGIGISEPWNRKSFNADVYAGIGYYSTQYETISTTSNETFKTNYNGINYHLGVKLHPFSDNIDVILEVQHNGTTNSPNLAIDTDGDGISDYNLNQYNGILTSKSTRGFIGVGYTYESIKLSVKASRDDLIFASISVSF